MIFAAIDWAEQRHRVILMDDQGTVLERTSVTHDQPGLSHLDWLLTHEHDPATVHVAIELYDSLLLDRLLRLGVRVYGLTPKSAERTRERFTPAGLKDDDRDAWSMAEFLRSSHVHLRPLQPDSDATLALREWVALREDLVQERTVQIQRLRNHLVRWHPHGLEATGTLHRNWVLDLLEDFPTGVAARNEAHAAEVRHRVTTIRTLNQRLAEVDERLQQLVDEHPEAIIFRSFPNTGTVTTAAMLAGFGEDRQRWNGHQEVAARWGVAPITLQSGKHRTVRRRRACDTTIHQAWLWFAFNTIRKEGCWARDDYQAKRKAGIEHYTALRGVADRWVKIAYRCWHDRVPYDEAHHQQRRVERLKPRTTK